MRAQIYLAIYAKEIFMKNDLANIVAPEITALTKFDHSLTRRISRSITRLVRAGNISGPEIEALAAIAAGYDLLTEPDRTAQKQRFYDLEKDENCEEKQRVKSKGRLLDALPALLESTSLERDFLAWWTRLHNSGVQLCMPVVLDVAVQGLSLTKVGEKRHCDKRTAKVRLLTGLRHYLAARTSARGLEMVAADDPTEDPEPAPEEDTKEDPEGALRDAIARAGGQTALAELIGTNQQNISYWLKKGETSIKFVRAVELATTIPASRLRPDVFGKAANRARGEGSLADVSDADFDDPRVQWVDSKPRCLLCRILLTDGAPLSPCYRQGCSFAVPDKFERVLYSASSLSGDDYTMI
jgi:DNA-binding transcriptional regulator YdaS (Cro superfamily)